MEIVLLANIYPKCSVLELGKCRSSMKSSVHVGAEYCGLFTAPQRHGLQLLQEKQVQMLHFLHNYHWMQGYELFSCVSKFSRVV